VGSENGRLVGSDRQSVAVGRLAGKRALLARRTLDPLIEVAHELLALGETVHGDVERRIAVEEARLTPAVGLVRLTEG
jgi:hypothetical protein